MSVLEILNELASDNGRLFKESVLLREKDNLLLKEVVRLALDPTVNFYIKKIPNFAGRLDSGVFGLTWAMSQLTPLSSRELTGHAAIDHLTMILENLGMDDAVVVIRIIDRDLRCGVSEATVNKIWKKLIPEFPYMRCNLPTSVKIHQWDWAKGIYCQFKADGSFANVIHEGGEVRVMTRSGNVYPADSLGTIDSEVLMNIPDNTVMNGELLIYSYGVALPREVGNGKLNKISQGGSLEPGEEVRFLAWDIVPYDAFVAGVHPVSYDDRFTQLAIILEKCTAITLIETYVVESFDQAMQYYNKVISEGFEGAIIKTRSGVWKDGTSKDQVKLKVDCDVELKMIALNPGKGKNALTFGSVQCVSLEGEFEVNVSGFKDDARKFLFENWATMEGGIITARINNIMKPTKNNPKYSAFLPRFIEHRPEKSEPDSLQRIIDQYDSIVKGTS